MNKFKAGDEITFIGADGNRYTETINDSGYMTGAWTHNMFTDSERFFNEGRTLVSINHIKNTTMTSIKTFLKSIGRQEPEKSFVTVGFLDDSENVTEKGREALEYVVWNANKVALKELADQIIADKEDIKK